MTYEEVCGKAHQVVSRERLVELTKDMNLMERATFVQALSSHVDFLTVCIYNQNNRTDESPDCAKEKHDQTGIVT